MMSEDFSKRYSKILASIFREKFQVLLAFELHTKKKIGFA